MTVAKTVSLWCDAPECSTADAWNLSRDYSTATEVRRAARLDGWTRRDGKDYCPEHSDEADQVCIELPNGDLAYVDAGELSEVVDTPAGPQ